MTELDFQFSKSSGPGGQHVNKTESRVELRFNVSGSYYLTDHNKSEIIKKLGSRITDNGILILTSQESRSQLKNKEIVIERFFDLLQNTLKKRVQRILTKPTRNSIETRIDRKKRLSVKKHLRRKNFDI